jgi:hypothetical protein
MKKTTLLLYCIMFVSALCAQRLNHQGKKMVRSVTSFAPNSPNRKDTIRYNFYYDDECRLIKVDELVKSETWYPNVGWVKDKGFKLSERLEYKDGRLHRTDYDEYGKRKPYSVYSYVLDSDRYVVERIHKDMSGTKEWYLKEVTRFTYDYPYKDDIRQIVKETNYSFIGEFVKGKRVEKEVVGDRYDVWYDIIGGNTYRHGSNNKYACEYNDLNINLWYLFDGLYDIERLTEWYNFYSRCLPSKVSAKDYRYTFMDSEPYNLIKAEKVGEHDGTVYTVWLIEYVY